VITAGVGLAAYQGLYFLAVRLGGVSIATVVSLGIAPVLLSAWETLRTRQRPSTATLAASAAAIIGLLLIGGATMEPGASTAAGLGLLAAIGSGVVYAASTAISRHTMQGVEPLTLTTLSCTIGAISILPLAAVEGLTFTPEAGPIALLVYAGAITTALAYALFYTGLRRISGSVAVVVTLLEPLTAALLAVLLINEPLGLTTMIGGLLLLGAVSALYLDAGDTSEHPSLEPLPADPIIATGTPDQNSTTATGMTKDTTTESGKGTDQESDAEPGPVSGTGPESGAKSGTGPESGTEPRSGPELGTDSGSGLGSASGTGSGRTATHG
jgi:DME family drug/metabolite transporter